MIAKFNEAFEKACEEQGINIESHDSVEWILYYNGITFFLQVYEYQDKVFYCGGIANVCILGEEYGDEYSIISMSDLGESELIEDSITEIIDYITQCDVRKRMLRLVKQVDSLFNDAEEDEVEFITEYLRHNYV